LKFLKVGESDSCLDEICSWERRKEWVRTICIKLL